MGAAAAVSGRPGPADEPEPPARRRALVVVANRLPVDEVVTDDGGREWRRSPGGLVTALHPILAARRGHWVGWAGSAGPAPDPFELDGIQLHPVPLSAEEVADYYEGQSNSTIWPLYHDAVETPGLPPALARGLPGGQPPLRRGDRPGGAARGVGVGAGLPAPAGAGDAARAPAGPAHRVLPAHPVPAGRAVHAAAAARGDHPRAARGRPGRLPEPAGRAELPAPRPPPARGAAARAQRGPRRPRRCGPARSRSPSTSTRWRRSIATPAVRSRADEIRMRARASRRR